MRGEPERDGVHREGDEEGQQDEADGRRRGVQAGRDDDDARAQQDGAGER